jgi:DNA-binding NarL/FixJ family response regulator
MPISLLEEKLTAALNPIRIAIADDHKLLRGFLVEHINSHQDCKVVLSVSDGEELLVELDRIELLPDICVIDINMPVLNGYDTQREIKRRWPDLRTLALSLHDESETVIPMLHLGANGFISKSAAREKIYEALVAIFRKGNYPYAPNGLLGEPGVKEMPMLLAREKEYVNLICSGLNNEEIAQKMCISVRTLEHYRDDVYRKLKVSNKAELILFVNKTRIAFVK